jgi:hypothetical protein
MVVSRRPRFDSTLERIMELVKKNHLSVKLWFVVFKAWKRFVLLNEDPGLSYPACPTFAC